MYYVGRFFGSTWIIVTGSTLFAIHGGRSYPGYKTRLIVQSKGRNPFLKYSRCPTYSCIHPLGSSTSKRVIGILRKRIYPTYNRGLMLHRKHFNVFVNYDGCPRYRRARLVSGPSRATVAYPRYQANRLIRHHSHCNGAFRSYSHCPRYRFTVGFGPVTKRYPRYRCPLLVRGGATRNMGRFYTDGRYKGPISTRWWHRWWPTEEHCHDYSEYPR